MATDLDWIRVPAGYRDGPWIIRRELRRGGTNRLGLRFVLYEFQTAGGLERGVFSQLQAAKLAARNIDAGCTRVSSRGLCQCGAGTRGVHE